MMKKHLTCGMHVIGLTSNACAGIKRLIMSLVIKQLKHPDSINWFKIKLKKLVIFTVDMTVVFAILESPFPSQN